MITNFYCQCYIRVNTFFREIVQFDMGIFRRSQVSYLQYIYEQYVDLIQTNTKERRVSHIKLT